MRVCSQNYPFLALDFCTLCGGYDTIQTYIPWKKKDNMTIHFHVCEKCLATKSVEEMISEMDKKFPPG